MKSAGAPDDDDNPDGESWEDVKPSISVCVDNGRTTFVGESSTEWIRAKNNEGTVNRRRHR